METTPQQQLGAAEKKLQKLLERQKALQAQIQIEQGRVRERERRARTRRLIELGGLVELAGLGGADKGTLLGALLEVATEMSNTERAAGWKRAGDALLARREAERKRHEG